MAQKPGNQIVAMVAVLIAMGTVLGWFQPIAESGPMPYPSRAEVDKLRKETQEGLAATLETAKAAAVAAQQAVVIGNDNRLDRLLQTKVQLEALIAMNPSDTGLKLTLERTVRQIGELSAQKGGLAPALTGAPTGK